MNRILDRTVPGIVSVLLLMPVEGSVQRHPDFSGRWVLVEALMSGPGRDGATSDGPRKTTSTTINEAAFNCGRGCTITQKGQTLTVADAQLPASSKPPAVTIPLDGRTAQVIDSFNPSRELKVTARWDGTRLVIESGSGAPDWEQVLTMEKDQFVVVTTNLRHGGEATFNYDRR